MDKKKRKKILNWFSNIALVVIILILLIPALRVRFQAMVQGFFMGSMAIHSTEKTQVNIAANDWVLYNQSQKAISFNNLKGKPIVLNFWATWCPGCRAELPELYDLYKKINGKAHLVCVSNESFDIIKKSGVLKKYGEIIFFSEAFHQAFDFSVYPTTFIINSNFEIVSKIEGAYALDSEENIDYLNTL